jgi:hypothetical protein
LKIAFVKQDIYNDLYVCANRTDPRSMLESTIMRIGPLGLFTLFDADFHIVHACPEPECRIYRKSYRPPKDVLAQLKATPINEIKGAVFDYLAPRSGHSHAEYAVPVDSVSWGDYDAVVAINVAVPTRIVRRHPGTLWCYMMGEASRLVPYVEFGYDAMLTQDITGNIADGLGAVDFPYTFLGPDCLERIAREYGLIPDEKQGVFAEINCTRERPVVSVPQLDFLRGLGHEVVVHHQDIVENLARVARSKYFVKLGGRRIRGNSVIEAVSAGTVVLMDPKDVRCAQLLPKESWAHSREEIEDKIRELDRDSGSYRELLAEQRKRIESFVVDAPMESLNNCLGFKRAGKRADQPTAMRILREIRRNYF